MKILLRLPDNLHSKIKEKAKEKGLSVSSMIRFMLVDSFLSESSDKSKGVKK